MKGLNTSSTLACMTATLASCCAFDLEIQSVFSGHWPSPSPSSPSSSLSLATTERDAADGQPAFRHHQCRLGDGRRATWPDRRKRQGEHNLFFFSLSDQRQTPEISPAAWPDRTANGGEATIHHRGPRSSLPQVGLQSFYPSTAVCDYSHAAVIDIPHTICLTSFLSMNCIRWFH